MEAVGQLAGGIAHDFNNLLTAIIGFGEMAFNGLDPADPNRELLSEIRRAGQRAANLTRQLLAFSRKQVLRPEVVSLNALLCDVVKLLQRLISENIEVILSADETLGLTRIDPGQFEQGVINLAVNARDAMPHGGRLIIETRNVEIDRGLRLGPSRGGAGVLRDGGRLRTPGTAWTRRRARAFSSPSSPPSR
jgi:signal transduction histidine kinase